MSDFTASAPNGKSPKPDHTYVGQEAVDVGVCAHLRREDVVFSTHWGHGHALAKGVAPRQLFAEIFGRATGCSLGRWLTPIVRRSVRGYFLSARWLSRSRMLDAFKSRWLSARKRPRHSGNSV
jgi:TPP-dependent pyruvate/acetoin dehydrogenase alpha subunit